MPDELKHSFERILKAYRTEKEMPLKGNALARFITHDVRNLIQSNVGNEFLVSSSVGKGNWAEVPWVAIFDVTITKSARKGYYPVYLFSADGKRVYLSLNQARHEVFRDYGAKVDSILLARAEEARNMLEPFASEDLFEGVLDLGSDSDLPTGYSAGNILAFEYMVGDIPSDEVLVRDLHRILSLYRAYIAARNGLVDLVGEEIPDSITPGEEAKRYRWHRRAERNRKLSKDAKKFHGYRCQVCQFDFERQYGDLGHEYIEAHHIVPLAELLKELEPVVLDPKLDFVVVCSNCHRMLHRVKPVLHPKDLREQLASLWELEIRGTPPTGSELPVTHPHNHQGQEELLDV